MQWCVITDERNKDPGHDTQNNQQEGNGTEKENYDEVITP